MMSDDDTTQCYVVTYGESSCIKDVHGVFMDEDRANIAAEELGRVYDDIGEWASVETQELVTERGYQVDNE
jgi:hypothetical protein